MSNKDDLLNIENGNTQNNMKKILIYVAIAFLIFVIGVIGFAIIQNSSNSEKNAIIPPEVKSQPKQENLFKQIPIENENAQQNTQNVQKTQNTKNFQKNIKEEIIQNSENIPEEKEAKKVIPQKPKEKLKPVIETKPEIKKSVKVHKKTVNNKKYYIQVAALLRYKKPNPKFLKLITKNGYKYRFFVTYTKLKGEKVKVTKVLIGPFSTKKEAKKALKRVKDNITQNAFIFKVK